MKKKLKENNAEIQGSKVTPTSNQMQQNGEPGGYGQFPRKLQPTKTEPKRNRNYFFYRNRNRNYSIYRLNTSTGIETVIKSLPKNKSQGPDGVTGVFYHTFSGELTPTLLKTFQKSQREENSQTHYTRPPDANNQTKISPKKENYKPISLMNFSTKIAHNILAKRVQQHIKRIIHHDQLGFIPGM